MKFAVAKLISKMMDTQFTYQISAKDEWISKESFSFLEEVVFLKPTRVGG